MTTPNEDLILKLRGQAYTTCRPDQLCDQAADLLQSQAERIKELEKQHIERLLRIEKEVDVLVAERDELREKYTDTYWALDDAARENTSLRAQLAEIAAAKPVAYRWVWKSKPWDIEGWCYTNTPPTLPELQEIEQLFTHPMPAQDVTELVEALQLFADALPLDKSTVKTCYAVTNQMRDAAHAALSKYKGVK